MFILWFNATLYVCAIIVLSVVGFVIYGCIKGFDNIFKDD